MCLRPINVKNPAYVDGSHGEHFVYTVPCGYCEECLKARQNSYMIRTREELLHNEYSFITLTYKNEKLPKVITEAGEERGSLCRAHTALFLNSFRHWCSRKEIPFPRYFLCGEYGFKTFRPHYHLLLGTQDASALYWCTNWWRIRFGLVDVKKVSRDFASYERTARYLAKYTAKSTLENRTRIASGQVRPYCLHSRDWGLSLFNRLPAYRGLVGDFGEISEYVTQQINQTSVGDFRYKLPKYYRKKLQDGILYNAVSEVKDASVDTKKALIKRHKETLAKINTISNLQRGFGFTRTEALQYYDDPNFVFPTRTELDESNSESQLKVKRLQAESKDRF